MMMKLGKTLFYLCLYAFFSSCLGADNSVQTHQTQEIDAMPTIIIYTKDFCPYCDRAKELLERKGLKYTEIDLDKNPDKIKEMITLTKRRSVPQIFINDNHIGGCDDLYDLEAQGKLDSYLNT